MDKVTCPYCGAEMARSEIFDGWDENADAPIGSFYRCECGASSPEAKPDAAYAAAMQRWQEPNRVMTWDEVVARCKAGEPIVIQLGDDAANPFYIIGFNQIYEGSVQVFHMRTYRNREYGETWRCWSHRPTDEERAGARWVDEAGE